MEKEIFIDFHNPLWQIIRKLSYDPKMVVDKDNKKKNVKFLYKQQAEYIFKHKYISEDQTELTLFKIIPDESKEVVPVQKDEP